MSFDAEKQPRRANLNGITNQLLCQLSYVGAVLEVPYDMRKTLKNQKRRAMKVLWSNRGRSQNSRDKCASIGHRHCPICQVTKHAAVHRAHQVMMARIDASSNTARPVQELLAHIPISSKTGGGGNAPAKICRPFSSIDSICLRSVLGFRVVGYSKYRRMKSAAFFRMDSDNFSSFTTLAIVSAPIMVVAAAMARFFA